MDLNVLKLRSITPTPLPGPRLVHGRTTVPDLAARSTFEAEVMSRLASGDEEALSDLMNLYWRPLQEYAAGLLGSSDAAEDVAQEAFVRLWDRRADWHPGSVRAYLYRSARNLALNEQRHGRVRGRWLLVFRQRPHTAAGSAADAVEELELHAAARRAVQRLPPRRREVFLLARFHGLSYKQIAEIMGISQQTVANQMSSAIGELRVFLAAFL
jgi:RNA polymerase sigma-70 factor (ECF subfamily)